MLLQLSLLLFAACGACSANDEPISRHHHQQHHRQPKHHQHQQSSSTLPSASASGNEIEHNATGAPKAMTATVADDDYVATKPYADCDYFQNIVADKSYDIYSPGYAENAANAAKATNNRRYAPDTQCRWIAHAPEGHTIRLQCVDVALPMSSDCQADRLEISDAGRADLADAKRFCGVGSFVSDSSTNKLAIALRTLGTSNGGYFRCKMMAAPLPLGTTQYCTCGRHNRQRIVGGTETGINEYPMMAGLIRAPRVRVFCGATIVARQYAVSAAHCIADMPADELGVLVGDHNINVRNDTRYAALYRVGQTILHERYNGTDNSNDIALLRTQNAMAFNEGVSAVCLPFKYAFWRDRFVGAAVEALGWGTIEFGGPVSPFLQEVALTVITNEQCAQAYPGSSILPTQMCTYRPNKDTCQFDSGGPLLYTDRSNYLLYLVGIVSFGNACGSRDPSVNTRTTSYVGWIQANTPGVLYCFR